MKMKIPVRRSCISLIVLSALVEAIRANENENSTTEGRQGRVSGRIVKLYSGYKPDPVVCIEEGFKADPVHCTVFYRCVKSSSGKFTVFKFQCGPGTVYDPETEVCNHPSSTKRSECGGIESHVENNEDVNEIEQHELPSPISTILPVFASHANYFTTTTFKAPINNSGPGNADVFIPLTENGYIHSLTTSSTPYQVGTTSKEIQDFNQNLFYPWTNYKNSTQQKITSSTTIFPVLEKRQPCTSDGFMGDSENCKKFYRCVSNLRGGFVRYEFVCSEPTVWDDHMQSCNHPWAVRNKRCGRGNMNNENTEALHPSINYNAPGPEQTGINFGDKHSKLPEKGSSDVNKRIESPVNYGDRLSNADDYTIEKNQIGYDSHFNQPTILNEDKNIKTEATIHRDVINNNNYNYNFGQKTTVQASYSTNKLPEDSVSKLVENGRSFICTHSGFIGDSYDCKKFYRCVKNGKGSFTKYEFTCSQGTVWDKKLNACNYAWAVKEFGGISAVDSSVSADTIESTSTSANGLSENVNLGYPNQLNQEYESSTTITVSTPVSLISTTVASNQIGTECTGTGFMGDRNDCKKFYRCVDNGRGIFTKYEYKCGDGTLWDQNIEACNHAWAVHSCNPSSSDSTVHTTSVTTVKTHTTEFLVQSTTPEKSQDNNDYSAAYGPQQEEIPLDPGSDQLTTSAPMKSQENDCKSAGFIGDTNDCKKFYRCVNNGQRGFIKYEFSCGDGTVWDAEIVACNHAEAVKTCGTSIPLKDEVATSSQSSAYFPTNDFGITTAISSIQTSTQHQQQEIGDFDSGYGQQQTVSTKIPDIDSKTTTLKTTHTQTNNCQASGFIGDVHNCKKFYRCVDNGNGGFIQYEFSCGEGTVWDSEIEACNHAWAVKHCGISIPSNENIVLSSTTNVHELESSNEYVTQNYIDSENTTPYNNTQTTSTSIINDNSECKENGFMGDKSDCNKFYRCVDSGNGTYIRYAFSCGEGTLWDSQINACNHAWAVKGCESSKDPITNISIKPTSNPSNDEIIEGHATPSYNNSHNYVETTTSPSSTTMLITVTNNECKSSGFMGDINDCKKFYRCVDNGNGSFDKYEFTCGEGTVWDSKIEACNHKWAVEKCAGNSNNEFVTTTIHSLPPISPAVESGSTSTLSVIYSSSTVSTTTVNLVPSHEDSVCSFEGIFADPNDCKKFYRCVNDGKDGYTKYEFSCAEGTAWDMTTNSCNYLSKVEACQTNKNPLNNTTDMKPIHDEQTIESDTTKTSTLASTSITDNTKPLEQNTCREEGYFGDINDCKKFYRCVYENDEKYKKYDFICGDGTIWDQDIITCNHPYDVKNPSCTSKPESTSPVSNISTSTSSNETPHYSTDKPSSTTSELVSNKNETNSNCSNSTTENPNSKNFTCHKAGFYSDPSDCKKFYRCVDWENNGEKLSIYHFDCADGTIWDPALETCNHENSVYPPRNCNGTQQHNENTTETSLTTEETTSTTNQAESTTISSESTKTSTQSTATTEFSTTQTTQSSTTKKPTTQSSTTKKPTTQSSTTKKTTTKSSTTKKPTTQTVTTEQPTTQSSTTEESTTQPSITQQPTTQSSTTEESTTQSSTTEESTTQSSTTEESTTQSSTTEESTTQSSTTEQPTTQSSTTQSSTTEESTTQSSTTEESTTQSSTTVDSTTQSSTTEESTAQSSTTEESTTQSSTTEESTTQSSTTTKEPTTAESTTQQTTVGTSTTTETDQEQTTKSSTLQDTTTVESSTTTTQMTTSATDQTSTTTDSSTTETSSSSTTENNQESTTETSTNKDCPDIADDQSLYVCPTSFKRHPKYCNLFYQCTEDNDSHELKIAVFNCPNNTIYDESKIQCVENEKSSKKCNGQISQKHRVKRLGAADIDPFIVTKESMACRNTGHFPFEKHTECSSSLLKCELTKSGKLRGFVYRCPEGFVYWTISRRCEPTRKVRDCKRSSYPWKRRYDIPLERFNIAP